MFLLLIFFVLSCFWDKVFLCCLGWPWTLSTLAQPPGAEVIGIHHHFQILIRRPYIPSHKQVFPKYALSEDILQCLLYWLLSSYSPPGSWNPYICSVLRAVLLMPKFGKHLEQNRGCQSCVTQIMRTLMMLSTDSVCVLLALLFLLYVEVMRRFRFSKHARVALCLGGERLVREVESLGGCC